MLSAVRLRDAPPQGKGQLPGNDSGCQEDDEGEQVFDPNDDKGIGRQEEKKVEGEEGEQGSQNGGIQAAQARQGQHQQQIGKGDGRHTRVEMGQENQKCDDGHARYDQKRIDEIASPARLHFCIRRRLMLALFRGLLHLWRKPVAHKLTPHGSTRRTQKPYRYDCGFFRASAETRPRRMAHSTACVRLCTPSFARICLTCVFTVSSAICNVRAISLFACPSAIRRRTSISRAVSGSVVSGKRTCCTR